jgi:hypothetical protein
MFPRNNELAFVANCMMVVLNYRLETGWERRYEIYVGGVSVANMVTIRTIVRKEKE